MIPTWVTDPKSGDLYINDLAKFVKGGVLVPAVGVNPLVVPAALAAANPTFGTPVTIEGGQDGVREIFNFTGAFDATTLAAVANRFSVLITDTAYRRRLSNRDVLVNHIFGTPRNPSFLAQKIYLENQQTLQLQFFNNSVAGAATFRHAMECRDFQAQALTRANVTELIAKNRRNAMFLNPFWMTSDQPIIVPAGGNVLAQFTNTRDYYLILRYIIASTISAGIAGDLQEVFSFQIFDAKTQRPLNNVPITMNTATGTAQFPFVMPCAMLVEPVTSIQVQITNLITDAPTEIFFTFHGVGAYVADANPWENALVDMPSVMPVHQGAT